MIVDIDQLLGSPSCRVIASRRKEVAFNDFAVFLWNGRYQQLAEDYSTGIVPAWAKRPRDTAAAKSAVDVMEQAGGSLAEQVFTTVQAQNAAIGARLVEINERIPWPRQHPVGTLHRR